MICSNVGGLSYKRHIVDKKSNSSNALDEDLSCVPTEYFMWNYDPVLNMLFIYTGNHTRLPVHSVHSAKNDAVLQ